MVEELVRFPYGVEETPKWIYDWVSVQPWHDDMNKDDNELTRRLYGLDKNWREEYNKEFIKMAVDKHNVQVFVLIGENMFIDVPVNEETTIFLLKNQQLTSTKRP